MKSSVNRRRATCSKLYLVRLEPLFARRSSQKHYLKQIEKCYLKKLLQQEDVVDNHSCSIARNLPLLL